MASNTSGRTGVVALLSRYIRSIACTYSTCFPGDARWNHSPTKDNGTPKGATEKVGTTAYGALVDACGSDLLSLFHRHVMVGIVRPEIFGAGANQAVIVELLNHVRCPAADARDREYWGEQIFIDAQHVIGGGGIEIHVGVQLLFRFHELLNFFRHPIPLRLAARTAQIA